jgi:1,5-anhydro-D-fructose reductase (1,5-anhydro-D-mannitol-forming)
MIRLAMLSFWHVHARDYQQQARTDSATSIVAVWDEVPERGRTAAQALNVPFYETLDELLANDAIDAVIVDTPTTMHREVIVSAALGLKHLRQVPTGGDEFEAAWEQWEDGNNVLALEPGVVMA